MVAVVVLAAGRGSRMKSSLPKVLHSLGGKTLVERVLDSASSLNPIRRMVIVGYEGAQVKSALVQASVNGGSPIEFVEQTEQLGTGHAVQQVIPSFKTFDGDVLILNGDVPLLRPTTLEQMLRTHREQNNAATLLTAQFTNPQGYGRVFCNENNVVTQIIEDRDCTPAQKQNRRINAGVYCFRWADLAQALPQLQDNNDQSEYYLTDVIAMMSKVMAVDVDDQQEILGINNRKQLAAAYDILQTRIKDQWMMAGVTIRDPASVTIDDTVVIEPDAVIEPQTHLRGNSYIATGACIGPGSLIENSEIGEATTVRFSVVSDSVIQANSRIGPYTHIRGQAQIGQNCRLGNFVEVKKSTIGDRTNAAHLAYLGDATLGENVNIGAGTITANYDGINKHPTILGDRTKTGANSTLVAPLTVADDVTIAAGSTVTDDVPEAGLVIARSRQVVKPGWTLKPKKTDE
ncbi:MAG: bifunctional UDP-N-acetylglucosamine diphosphorylase/glucosamine-1-phosphate N-acetyltransferase GlmU [Merismopedia sp. SIO2A8]|nr:bifunctional UDP-N-acetylglucosamine diphosphorylase/glucosamine-1-phosphate N-acetyltransferase GlmU [Merismopedia sp. SIO2A8]